MQTVQGSPVIQNHLSPHKSGQIAYNHANRPLDLILSVVRSASQAKRPGRQAGLCNAEIYRRSHLEVGSSSPWQWDWKTIKCLKVRRFGIDGTITVFKLCEFALIILGGMGQCDQFREKKI
jgi:hypothetical protein